ncbi:MAG: hypothetical protein AB1611_21870 [bacterium]
MAEINLTTSDEIVYEDSDSGWKEAIEIYFKEFVSFFFPIIYREEELEASRNPFGIIVLAHLKSLETKRDYQSRLLWKLSLVKMLYNKGYSRGDIFNLYRFIDWLLVLPKELSRQFQDEIRAFEEEKKMAYITTAERIGIEKGRQEGMAQALYNLYCEGVLTSEQAKAELKKLYTNKSLSEEIYREFMSKIQGNS